MMHSRAAILIFLTASVFGCDPVHTDAENAIPSDPSRERNGPTHRAGQPCLVCHDGSFQNPPKFNVAGTVYNDPTSSVGANGVTVTLTGADGSIYTTQTNRVGNFYVEENRWTPVYPMHVKISGGGVVSEMKTHVGRDGSCAGCHFDPAGAASPGHVYLHDADGGGY